MPPFSLPTFYNGTRFRSRLEARWAEAFDKACIKWEYEPEGWRFGKDLCYLPDFYLPELRTIVEVKGILDGRSADKLVALEREATLNHVLAVLAETPAGERWARVGSGFELTYSSGFDSCPDCDRTQFFGAAGCRVCEPSKDPAREWSPPYSDAQWVVIWRWWAKEFMRAGRSDDAMGCAAEAARLSEGSA